MGFACVTNSLTVNQRGGLARKKHKKEVIRSVHWGSFCVQCLRPRYYKNAPATKGVGPSCPCLSSPLNLR